jgi:PAS domain S-box-containing protein
LKETVVKEIGLSCPDRERPRGWEFRRTTALFIAVPVVAAGVVWLATRFVPGPLASFLVPAAVAIVTIACLALLRPRGGGEAGIANLAALRRASEVIHHAEEGIVTVNARGLVLDMNPAAEKLFGYNTAEVANRPISLLLTEPPSHDRSNVLRESLPTGSILGLAAGAREVIGIHKSGETFPLEMTGNSILVGEEYVSVAFVRDVSKRKRAQRYLLAHYTATCILAEVESLGEAMPRILQTICEALQWEAGAFWQVNPDTNLAACREVYQTPPAALPPWPDASLLICKPGEGLPGRVWSTRQPAWIEDMLSAKDCFCPSAAGIPSLRGAFAVPILIGQEVCGMLTLFSSRKQKREEQLLDVMAELGKQLGHFVARKRDEEKLRETTQAIQAMVDAAPVAIHIVDLENRVRLWNPAAERIFGWTSAEVLGNLLPALRDGECGPADHLPPRAESLDCRGRTVRCPRKDGAAIEVSLSTAPLVDAAGKTFGVVGIRMDLTEQKNLEDQLRQSQKMEAVGQLAGGVAHDFNNLLTIILGYCQVLLAAVEPGSPARLPLEEIQKAGERAAGLTRQLLAFSRKQIIQPRVLDLNDVVSGVQKMLGRLIGEDIQLFTTLASRLGRVSADPGQIEQILVNLAVNARDAMPTGGRLLVETSEVRIGKGDSRVGAELPLGRYAQLTVTDTGCGMDSQTLARIFEPFFTTKEQGKGTGLGLATVYGIVKQSGGHIRATSAPDKGTTFEVYLPVVDATAAPEAPPHGFSAPGGNETVLLVEDEDGVRALTRQMLQSKGYTVLEANNGEEALRVAERNEGTVDLLLTDVVMPRLGGRALAEALVSRYPNANVLYISGYTDDAVIRNGVMQSENEFLQKPFSPAALLRKVREVLDRNKFGTHLAETALQTSESQLPRLL